MGHWDSLWLLMNNQRKAGKQSVQKHAQIVLGKTCPGTTDMLPYLLLPIATSITVIFAPGGLLYERGGDARRLRGVNFRFWSRLGFSGQNTIIFSRKGLF